MSYLVRRMTRSNKRKKTPPKDEFESKHDYMPGFLEALGELADIYEDQDDFRKTALRRAIIALDGQIITAVEVIKLFKLNSRVERDVKTRRGGAETTTRSAKTTTRRRMKREHNRLFS